MREYGLGRLPSKDERDHKFLMRTLLAEEEVKRPKKKTWYARWVGDQKTTPQCVGYAWAGFLRCQPLYDGKPTPTVIYNGAQDNDEWEGTDYYGSSVRGGAKFLTLTKELDSYVWAFDIETLLNWLATKGPVVFGSNWYESMFNPNGRGELIIDGRIAGGHAYLISGYNDETERVTIINSWGRSWSRNGRASLRFTDLARLLREDGEACSAIEAEK